MRNENTLKWLGLPLVGAIIGSLLTVLFQQYFFVSNKQVEGSTQLRRELIKEQYSLYNKLKFWTDINTYTTYEIFIEDTFLMPGETRHMSAGSHTGGNLEFLAMAFDTILQKQLNELTEEIYKNQFNIESEFYELFDDLAKHKKARPFPSFLTYSKLDTLGWAEGKKLDIWKKANADLKQKIDDYINMK